MKRKPVSAGTKRAPKFRSEAAEKKFWETHDSTEHLDWSKAERMRLPNLKTHIV